MGVNGLVQIIVIEFSYSTFLEDCVALLTYLKVNFTLYSISIIISKMLQLPNYRIGLSPCVCICACMK